MKTRVKMLKVKIKNLADEARTIRLEERRACGRVVSCSARTRPCGKVVFRALLTKGRDDVLREELYRHRVDVVRAEQRHSLLVYAFLRGRPLSAVEPNRGKDNPPDWGRVAKLVAKFGPVDRFGSRPKDEAEFEAWKAGRPTVEPSLP